jgi:hypothetical protein
MRTVGVDLAAQPRDTAVASIQWHEAGAQVTGLQLNAVDRLVLDLVSTADKAGVNSPFGWRSTFVDFVLRHRAFQPQGARLDSIELRPRCSDHIEVLSPRGPTGPDLEVLLVAHNRGR